MQPRSCPLFLQQLIRDGEGAVQGVGEGSKAKGLLVSGTHVLSAVLAPADGVLHLLLALDCCRGAIYPPKEQRKSRQTHLTQQQQFTRLP
ncbi:hypothetical protein TNCV_2994361 [Trichonephila clavipes]|nr:hypothetical protein TNCV_2994361 [Trichonephila clavipes]